jgi:hypothetical protein
VDEQKECLVDLTQEWLAQQWKAASGADAFSMLNWSQHLWTSRASQYKFVTNRMKFDTGFRLLN